ncbi:MAG: hypothetical protein AAFV87_14475 [Pseudomonadota bacterium]
MEQADRGINLVECVLSQIDHFDEQGPLPAHIVIDGHALLAGHLHHLAHLFASFQMGLQSLDLVDPVGVDAFGISVLR